MSLASLQHRTLNSSVKCVRVAARADDGYFYPGVLVNGDDALNYGQGTYTMIFDNGQYSRVDYNRIVGNNFQRLDNGYPLRYGQIAYVSYYGSQVAANVIDHSVREGEVRLQLCKQPEVTIIRNVAEVNLVPDTPNKYRNRNGLKRSLSREVIYKAAKRRASLDEDNVMGEEEAALVLTTLCNSPLGKGVEESDSPRPLCNSDISYRQICDESPRTECSKLPPVQEQTKAEQADISANCSPIKTVYCCTWPKCRKVLSTYPGIIRHIRTIHFGDNTEKLDNGEEEFYFTEVEVTMDKVVDDVASVKPSSPTESVFIKEQNTYITKKSKGDGKKCRKVYGMENRHLWCTQCRWKKACTRFLD
ncbi:Zinc finger protein 704 [Trichoplax sp. H2]|uniref:C2H2-type domain-containing protein n=1 Tax=Trichoplax adhaerens TaxID=10228 RepID=B3S432_TRIAD|nr:hypothetical protein TRIADDRAFT_58936 [Trichoplax adhaerens]EDV22570.1 hypothetical protein TRIADDRAFT_58936 [Trichoplax adhaerens]RDD43705.1 Zinc finger protein 704 [Trichoplax sp. H2]|eukprot:XP_002115114.1 hypothetical protein TRIADDRAFT_58936 [Trichoplax adhaerens]